MDLPLSYVADKIQLNCARVVFKKYRKVYNFECPVCHEGKSKGKKRRGYYLIENHCFHCFNCNETWSEIDWLKLVCNLSFKQIIEEAKQFDDSVEEVVYRTQESHKPITYTLPKDCINLTDKTQLNYYKHDPYVRKCLLYLKKRRMFSAVNRPKTYYTTLAKDIHQYRLIIPFFNENGKIIFYQSRAVLDEHQNGAKYLSKSGAEFSVFGVDQIDIDYDFLFLFEGPIDSMFVKNGIAMGGLSLTNLQEKQLLKYPLHQRIWILDNQLNNPNVKKKLHELIETNQRVFIWPKKFIEFKDLNEICCYYNLDQISPKFFINNSYQGMSALLEIGKAG